MSPPDDDPLVLRPLITDIIRTQYCVPNSLFLVEGIDELRPSRNQRWRAIRLLLGDGELCIQAILTPDLHRFVDTGDVSVGSFLRVHAFSFSHEVVEDQPEARVAGKESVTKKERKMVYLTVEDFTVVGWHEEYARVHGKPKTKAPRSKPRVQRPAEPKSPTVNPAPRTPCAKKPPRAPKEPRTDCGDDDTLTRPRTTASRTSPSPTRLPPEPNPKPNPKIPTEPVPLARNWTHRLIPLKLTKLSSIPHLPYKQNWSTNVVAVICSLSPVEPSTFPPYRQRTARLADPSTSKRVHLTVFLDAEEFKPCVGSVVLLAGVKNHLFDGGSLKKYVSDRPREGMPWWVENPTFPWCKALADDLREWWRVASIVEDDDDDIEKDL
ncbi:hypothetical protein jhhlp_008135 [Lomentospora prolificans]|uniref:Uncharacterized protein n=1 Tax=Lomentospora prolificans TaxID=41688 RepID=A0A2N3MZL1_9PEZI|nr:hypothetical protein jhhlp_008135 [Lomentospora prolificans]